MGSWRESKRARGGVVRGGVAREGRGGVEERDPSQ